MYLLDTNIVSDLVRNPQGTCAAAIRRYGEVSVCTSIIVASELRYGALKRNSSRLSAQLDAVLSALTVHPLEAPADTIYGTIRTYLEQKGTMIGANDLLIAAHALTLGATLVTANLAEFSRIEDLDVVNWL
jgi:tRNA(fMet)-specific endonuclease VapC